MIVLDTNVVSELSNGPRADRRVMTWVRSLSEQPVTTVMTRAETLAGIERMPAERRRDELSFVMAQAFAAAPKVLTWDSDAVPHFAHLVATREEIGRPIRTADAVIASICLAHGATLATRNVKDFTGIGLTVVNPWES